MKICPCGGVTRDYETIAGTVEKCTACGRREVFPGPTQPLEPEQRGIFEEPPPG